METEEEDPNYSELTERVPDSEVKVEIVRVETSESESQSGEINNLVSRGSTTVMVQLKQPSKGQLVLH